MDSIGLEGESKLKLVQVSATLDLKLGGPSSVVIGTSKYLAAIYDFQLIVFGNCIANQFKMTKVSTLFENRFGLFMNFFHKKASKIISEADILLIHGYYLYSTLYSIFKSRANYVYLMPHGSLEPYQDRNSRFAKRIFRIVFKVLSSKKSIVFIVGSDSEKENIVKKFPSYIVEVVGLGIADEILNRQHVKKKISSPVHLLCFSRIANKKRIDLCIRALANLNHEQKKYRLTIAGTGEPKITKELQDLAVSLGVENETEFLGYVSDKDLIREIFINSDIFLLPSENENFAVAVAEAIGYGVPVVISEFVAMHKFVQLHNTGVIITSLDAEQIAFAIENVVSHYGEYRQSCLESAKLLSWELVIENWLQVFRLSRVINE